MRRVGSWCATLVHKCAALDPISAPQTQLSIILTVHPSSCSTGDSSLHGGSSQECDPAAQSVPAYTEILTLAQASTSTGRGVLQSSQPTEPGPSPQEIASQSLLDTSVIPSENREGPEMESFADLRDLDIDANEMYGLSNMEDLKRIMLYLKQYCKLTPRPPSILPK